MKNNNIKKTLSIAAAVAATASFVTANNVHADTVTNNQPATTAKDDSGIKPNQESTQAASSSATQTQATSTQATQLQAASSSDASTQAQATQEQAQNSSETQAQTTQAQATSSSVTQAQTTQAQATSSSVTQAQTTQAQATSSSVTQAQVDEAQKNVTDTQNQINQNQSQQDNVKQQISDADSQISNIQNDYNDQNVQIDNNEAQIVGNYQNQINNIQNNQVNDEKQNLNNQISDLNGQVQTLQDQQSSSSQSDDNSKYTNVDGETVTPSVDTQKVLDKIDTNADYMSNLYRNGLIGDTTGNSSARANGGYIISNTYGVDADADSGDNYSLKAGGDDSLIYDSSITSVDDMNQNYVINNKLSDVDPIKNGQLTTDQERELAIIVADKLNNTREKLGLSRWVMTEKDFELAQRRASQQSAINLQHNVDDINSVFGGVYGENLALAFLHEGDNFNDVMGYIDASVSQLIDSDKGSDYGHRDNILSQDGHIALGIKQVSDDTIMITMDWFDSDDDNGTDLLALPAQLKAQGPTKKATVVDNSAKIAQLKSQIADLEAKLANVQFNYDKLSSSDKKNYNNLKNEIKVTHAKANNARNALKQNSQASIDQVTQTKISLYNTLYDLQDQMKTLQDKLVLQKTKLVQLQEELNNSKSDNNKTDDKKDNVAPVTPAKPSEGNKVDNKSESKNNNGSYVSQRAKDAMMKALAETSERQAYTGDQIKYEDTAQNLDTDRQEGTKRIIAAFDKLPESLRKFVTYMSFYQKQDGYYGLTDSLNGKTWLNTQYYNLNAFDQSYGTLYHEISHSIDGKTFYTANGVEYSLSRDAQIVPLLKEIAPNAPVFETWANLFATYVMSRMHYQETVPTKDKKAMYYFDELLGEALFGSKAYADETHEDIVAPVTPAKPSEDKKDNVTPVTPAKPSEDKKDNVTPVTPVKPSEDKKDNVAPVTPVKPSEDKKDNVAPVTPVKPSEDKKDNVAPVTPAKPSEDKKDNVAPVTPANPSEDKKDNVAPVTPAKPSEDKTNGSAVDTAKQAINQSKGQDDFSEKEDVIELPDGSKLVNVYSQNGLVRYSATVLKDGTVRNIHEQLVRKTNDGKTINVTQGQDGSQTVYVTDKNGNTQSVKFNNGNIVNYSRQATQPKSDLAQTGSNSNVSESAALVEVALIFIAGLTGLAGIKLMKMKENK